MARQREARGQPPGWQRPVRGNLSQRVYAVRRDAGIAARAVNLGVFLAAFAVLATAGTSTAVLTPRWLGVIFLALASAAGIAAFIEARGLRRAILLRRLERRNALFRRQR